MQSKKNKAGFYCSRFSGFNSHQISVVSIAWPSRSLQLIQSMCLMSMISRAECHHDRPVIVLTRTDTRLLDEPLVPQQALYHTAAVLYYYAPAP